MKDGIPRISVRMISYNQERTIGRALESLLKQKDYIYEVCVNDDCSKDRTWEILQDYARQYPNLIKLHQNKENLGIFQNLEASYERLTGDMVYGLAGDDECPEDFFKHITDFIKKHQIDYLNTKVCILGDCEFVYPDGMRVKHMNDMLLCSDDVLSMKIRGLIFMYGVCHSRSIVEDFHKVSQGRSYIVEETLDDQLFVFSEKNYYMPESVYLYYAEYGVSSHMSKKTKEERVGMYDYLLKFLDEVDVSLSGKDVNYLHFRTYYNQYTVDCKKGTLAKAIFYYLRSITLKYGLRGLEIGRFFNHLKRVNAQKKCLK